MLYSSVNHALRLVRPWTGLFSRSCPGLSSGKGAGKGFARVLSQNPRLQIRFWPVGRRRIRLGPLPFSGSGEMQLTRAEKALITGF